MKFSSGFFTPANILYATGILIILASRALLSKAQINWDEELYYEIAKHWSNNFIPYRDIFDHKPPFVFLYYKIFSLMGESIVFLRVFQSAALLGSILCLWRALRDEISFVFVPMIFVLLSVFHMQGVNSEAIYIPFLLWGAAFLLRGSIIFSAIFFSLAVSTKYTVVLDVAGIFLAALALRVKFTNVARSAIFSVVVFVCIYLTFYIYFYRYGIDLIYQTITLNLKHSSTARVLFASNLFPIVFIAILFVNVFLVLLARLGGAFSPPGKKIFLAAVAWLVCSFVQSQITGRGYYHYFVPMYIPLCLITASIALGVGRWRSLLPIGSVCGALLALLNAISQYNAFNLDKSRLASVCGLGDFHYHGSSLYIYRECNVKPLKFMFVPFYDDMHFINISNSGGKEWLRSVSKTTVYDDGYSVKVFPDGNSFYEGREVTPVEPGAQK